MAYDNLGWLEIKLNKNFGEAIKDFEAGSQLQDPDSIVSLVEMIDKGYVPTDRAQELKDQLLRRAADLGHQGAQLQLGERVDPEEPQVVCRASRRKIQAAQHLIFMLFVFAP